MPQATEELRGKMVARFGTIDAGPPISFLEAAGYELKTDANWKPKAGVASVEDMTDQEFDCFWFLVTEWDFSDLDVPPTTKESSDG